MILSIILVLNSVVVCLKLSRTKTQQFLIGLFRKAFPILVGKGVVRFDAVDGSHLWLPLLISINLVKDYDFCLVHS